MGEDRTFDGEYRTFSGEDHTFDGEDRTFGKEDRTFDQEDRTSDREKLTASTLEEFQSHYPCHPKRPKVRQTKIYFIIDLHCCWLYRTDHFEHR